MLQNCPPPKWFTAREPWSSCLDEGAGARIARQINHWRGANQCAAREWRVIISKEREVMLRESYDDFPLDDDSGAADCRAERVSEEARAP